MIAVGRAIGSSEYIAMRPRRCREPLNPDIGCIQLRSAIFDCAEMHIRRADDDGGRCRSTPLIRPPATRNLHPTQFAVGSVPSHDEIRPY